MEGPQGPDPRLSSTKGVSPRKGLTPGCRARKGSAPAWGLTPPRAATGSRVASLPKLHEQVRGGSSAVRDGVLLGGGHLAHRPRFSLGDERGVVSEPAATARRERERAAQLPPCVV